MFKYLTSIIVVTILLLGCGNMNNDTPPIDPAKMKNILMDIHVAEYYSQGLGQQKGTFLKNMDSLTVFYKAIFEKHQIDLASFQQGMLWYQQHPVIFDTIYLQSISMLDSIKQHYKRDKNNASPSIQPDSVKK